MKRYLIALLAVAALVTGCGSGTGTASENGDQKPVAAQADPGDFCSNFKLYVLSGMAVGVAAFGNMQNDPDIAKARDAMQQAADNLAEHAPSEVRGDFELVRDYTNDWVAGLKKGVTKPPVETPEYKAASDRVVEYGKDKCGNILPGLPTPTAS
ncbi:hypothetical protein [Tenggerimyces flavus]|uniref:Lipoprotein n=1 Tax=Tenggerimyces flavus TaxID=1708749 RepID=A0ABV7Y471_9ACTN|nr:hypothetical protein [Tenggerimyces flavus]MBM7790645.1 hypothetical protein [Tenggerimyces flavus]